MEYGKLERELIELCRAYPPNFDAIRAKITEGADVNAGEIYSNIVSEILYDYGWLCGCGDENEMCSGEYLPAIIKICLDAGFDVSRFAGAYGGDALWSLVFTPSCREIFEVAEMLLKAGADIRYIPPDEFEDVLEAIRFDGLFEIDETRAQYGLARGELTYRLFLFLRDWPETTIEKCFRGWPKLKLEDRKFIRSLDLEEYLLADAAKNRK